jgi:hypothetical protein
MDNFSQNFGVIERQTHGILMGCHDDMGYFGVPHIVRFTFTLQ